MKTIKELVVLIGCIVLTACTMNQENRNQKESMVQPPGDPVEWVAEGSESAQKMDRYLSGMETLGFSGAVIVMQGDDVILRKGYGYANRETREPYTPHTVQTSGSVTKQFTGAAIVLLESRGELSVEDPISVYLDALSEEMQDITIHQLLTHSSGVPGGIGSDEEPIDAESYLERLAEESLQFEPGTGYAYSNTGYSLLAMIIENISGRSYEEFLREDLLLPAGMNDTGYLLPEWDGDQLAEGYRNGELWGQVYERGWIDDGPNWHLRGNGGMHTTVGDMARWLKTVQGRGVLDEQTARSWTTGYVKEGNGQSEYGYGWVVYKHDRWGTVITHSGSNRIFEADFVWLPDRDLFLYIQGNTSLFPAANQSGKILRAAFDADYMMPPIVTSDSTANPAQAMERAGTYVVEGGKLELTADDTRLIARLTGQPVFDTMFSHNREQQQRFTELNSRVRIAMNRLQNGEKDALSGLADKETDAAEVTAPFLRRIDQIGGLDSLHVIGSFANRPGSLHYDTGPWTTFVYAEFENWNQYWNLVWHDDETFAANLRGPWPSFILIPAGEGEYTGVHQSQPYETVPLRFSESCVELSPERACRDE